MLPWWVPWVGGGVAVVAIFWAGDNYGYNARQYAACKAETARRNSDVAKVNTEETARHAVEETERQAARTAFATCPGVQSCPLTADTAACLNNLLGAP
jgi:hypothetical protein